MHRRARRRAAEQIASTDLLTRRPCAAAATARTRPAEVLLRRGGASARPPHGRLAVLPRSARGRAGRRVALIRRGAQPMSACSASGSSRRAGPGLRHCDAASPDSPRAPASARALRIRGDARTAGVGLRQPRLRGRRAALRGASSQSMPSAISASELLASRFCANAYCASESPTRPRTFSKARRCSRSVTGGSQRRQGRAPSQA